MLIMRAIRVVRNVPLYVLGRRTGISPGRLSNIERELIVATPDERKKIAQSLGVKAAILFAQATTTTIVESQLPEVAYVAE